MRQNKKTEALIHLLEDPDMSVYKMVEKELLKEDAKIIPALEEMWELSLDEICQQRIENLIQYLQFKETKREMAEWIGLKNPDLVEGFSITNRYQYPDLNATSIEIKIEQIRKDVWLELNNSLTSLEKITVLNHIFFDVHGFSVNHANLSSPQNFFLNQVLETKKGHPIALAMLYTVVARRLDLPIYFINFPKNPLLGYFDRHIAIKAHGFKINSDMLFYINPSNKGSITGRKELEYYLKKMKYKPERKYFERCSDKVFVMKLISLLQAAFDSMGYKEKADEIMELKKIITSNLGK
ncbi:hypothetical protein MNBD_BACTEROID01-1370 [hydrothermal vent metagenome]|uniref:Protein SirB1 N-terminal domain-containing protein n=1 Tax=hydrothermal vent metagenome TaxID=652676 RepID=A0A3B0THC8_9ZZZZ